MSICTRVDLPEPVWPIRPMKRSSGISALTPSRAVTCMAVPVSYVYVTLSNFSPISVSAAGRTQQGFCQLLLCQDIRPDLQALLSQFMRQQGDLGNIQLE